MKNPNLVSKSLLGIEQASSNVETDLEAIAVLNGATRTTSQFDLCLQFNSETLAAYTAEIRANERKRRRPPYFGYLMVAAVAWSTGVELAIHTLPEPCPIDITQKR